MQGKVSQNRLAKLQRQRSSLTHADPCTSPGHIARHILRRVPLRSAYAYYIQQVAGNRGHSEFITAIICRPIVVIINEFHIILLLFPQ